jgi:hypothetical protein
MERRDQLVSQRLREEELSLVQFLAREQRGWRIRHEKGKANLLVPIG